MSQFTDFLVIILIIAGTISLIFGDYRNASIMYFIVLLNALIGFWQVYKTEKLLNALKNLLPQKTKVIRSGVEKEITAQYLVVGDIVIVQTGDAIPADGIILESYNFKLNESALTGESHAQTKKPIKQILNDNNSRVFMGTNVVEGQGKILITECGLHTKFGQIAKKTKQIDDISTPLQKKLHQVGKTVSYIAVTILIGIILFEIVKVNYFQHQAITTNNIRSIFLFSLALAAALVPEGLPATVSVALSVSAARLAKKMAVVKRLSSVETLGSTTVICTDKTGTLTTGKMRILNYWTPQSNKIINFSQFNPTINKLIVKNLVNCHNIKKSADHYFGDINEQALYKSLEETGVNVEKEMKQYKRLAEFSFNPERKMMSVIVESIDQSDNMREESVKLKYLYSKGAPQIILDKCHLTQKQKNQYKKISQKMASGGLRVFALAYQQIRSLSQKITDSNKIEQDLIFLGFFGLEDKIRPEVPESIKYCHRAGIRIIMITGDYKITARSIAEQINLTQAKTLRMIGPELINSMSDLELRENLLHSAIFYQAIPEQKFRIVKQLQEMGEIVAVTGDGVNDALALKKADIGVAMGITGTDVAKESADMVLLDDNFATIVNAIKEGRQIWSNLKKFLFYVFSSNAGEFMTAFLGMISGLPIPIMAVQILAVDLGTDILPSFALIFDQSNQNNPIGLPKDKSEKLLNKQILQSLFYVGLIMGGGAVVNYLLINGFADFGSELYYKGTTAAFATLVVCQIVNVYAVRNKTRAVFSSFTSNIYIPLSIMFEILLLTSIIYWQPLQYFLYTKPLDLINWLPIIAVGIIFWFVEEKRRNHHLADYDS